MPHHHAMSKKTAIYVLFKEYPDPAGRGKSAPYVQDSNDYLTDVNALLQDWTEIFDVLSFFSYERANRFYDEDNLEGLLDVARLFPNEYPGAVDTITSEIQAMGMTSWKAAAAPRTDVYHYGGYDVTNDLLGDMAQRENDHRETLRRVKQDTQHQLMPQQKEYEPCVLLQKGAITTVQGIVTLTTAGNVLNLQSVGSIAELHDWLSMHRFPSRHYVYNAKHGDAHQPSRTYTNRHGHTERAAQLQTTTAATRMLLKKAVGESVEGDLWYYDDANGCFIYFENQGDTPQHEYHAYHLRPSDKNFDKIVMEKLRKVQPHI